jgi:light-regulated signal transduction histidine kinase (bacteriophytochrome)
MAKLIDDLLELARVTRRDLQIRNCNLSAMAHDIFSELSTSSPERSFKVKVAPGMKVKADEGLLRIALDNLLRNAWKFTGLESEALIEVGCIDSEGDVRTFFVRDNGVGFDMAYVDKLFGAFQRLHSETEFQGTGIGLALVQRVIRRHGGQVWAEAEPQCGATFYFSMPAEVLITDLTAHLKAGT